MQYQCDDEKLPIRQRILLWLLPLIGALLALGSLASLANTSERGVFSQEDAGYHQALGSSRWGISYENDFFVPGGDDRDYTFGLAISHTREHTNQSLWHLPLEKLDTLLGLQSSPSRRGFEGGFYGFTPQDIGSDGTKTNDRPFSSLVYFASSHERIDAEQQSVFRTRLSIGALGLNIVGNIQEEFHRLIDNEEPKGWQNQISSGGELTAKYLVSKQRLIGKFSNHFELRETRSASIGYLSEVSWGISIRAGHLNSSWFEFNPDVASYAESSALARRGSRERFFWAGMAVKLRAYNAFLQGQFKDSAHEYSANDLNHIIVEAWAGYTQSFESGYFVSYGLRGHSSEVNNGEADRDVIWGGLMLGKKIL